MAFVRYAFSTVRTENDAVDGLNKPKKKYLFHFPSIPEYVERQCDADGNWAIRENSTLLQYPNGWTNFTPCYTDDMKTLLDKLGNEEAAQVGVTNVFMIIPTTQTS